MTVTGNDVVMMPEGYHPVGAPHGLKDPHSGNLDRIQIVTGWLDVGGATREKIFNVVWGDAHRRKLKRDGALPAVGSTGDASEVISTRR